MKKIKIQKDACPAMFTIALFIIARTWKQPKRPSMEKWIKKIVVHIYNRISLSHRKEQTNTTCSNTDGP